MTTLDTEICIIGLGPAGLGAALKLSKSNVARKTICLEAGVGVSERYCSVLQRKGCRRADPCQIISGVGGSSVLSGGKLSAFPAGRALTKILGGEYQARLMFQKALDIYQEYVHLIPPEIPEETRLLAKNQYNQKGFEFRYYDAYTYNQKDLIQGYNQMIAEIVESGISVYLGAKVSSVLAGHNGLHITVCVNGSVINIITKHLIVAVGRHGAQLLESMDRELDLSGYMDKIDVGIRLEFPTALWRDINICHNDLKLHFGKAKTFCVCKDGFIAPYRYDNIFLLEGAEGFSIKTGLTNLAIIIRIDLENRHMAKILLHHIKQSVIAQTKGKPVRQSLVDYLDNSNYITRKNTDNLLSSITYWEWGNVNNCFPLNVASELRSSVRFFVSRLISYEHYSHVSVYGPEVDYYWPTFPLKGRFGSYHDNVYLVGECTGHFHGILQAFCSGLQCSEELLRIIDSNIA